MPRRARFNPAPDYIQKTDIMTFAKLQLIEPLCRALAGEKYKTPTEIQSASIPHLLMGGDLLGSAHTGTGKTASFALPVLQQIVQVSKRRGKCRVRALVLTPTRELAVQVADSFCKYGKYTKTSCLVIHGGVGYGPQIRALRRGIDILVATPGRLLDLHNNSHLDLKHAQFLVIDEADRMFDMGFRRDLETIIRELPEERQTILFSATMPKEILKFAKQTLANPKRVSVSPVTITAQNIDDRVVFVNKKHKKALLVELLKDKDMKKVMVFTRTKHVAERLSKVLKAKNINVEVIHGNKSQNARQRSLAKFRNGKVRILVATDVAARGIDVNGITHVINYQLSNEPESYVHRVGRTARAGRSGTALTLCDSEESQFLFNVERLLKRKLVVEDELPYFDSNLAKRHLLTEKSRNHKGYRKKLSQGGAKRTASSRKRHRNARRRTATLTESYRSERKNCG